MDIMATRSKNNPPKARDFLKGKSDDIEEYELSPPEKSQKATITVKALNILSPDKKFLCQICRNTFPSHKKLIQHFREHGKTKGKCEKFIQCDSCSLIFPTPTKAIQHKHRAHPNVPNSFCQLCGKLFVLKNSLREHLAKDHPNQLSLSPSSIKCDYCSASFSTAAALQYHVKSMHQQINYILANDLYIPPSSTKIIRSNSSELFSAYYCHLCGVEYMIKNGLKKHLYEMHSIEERNTSPDDCIRCKTCEAMFFTKFAYEKHLTFHKPGDLYAANQEERIKVVSRVDQDFDIGRVPLLQEINTMLKQMTENHILPHMVENVPTISETTDIKLDNSAEDDWGSNDMKAIISPPGSTSKVNPTDIDSKDSILEINIGSKSEFDKILSSLNQEHHEKTDLKSTKTEKVCQKSLLSVESSKKFKGENEESPRIVSSIKKDNVNIDLCNKATSEAETLKLENVSTNTNSNLIKNEDEIQMTTPRVEKVENKMVIKSQTDATMKIVNSQNKVIVLKKVMLKKKPKVKVKNKETR